jgi:hypothetical protein
MFSENEISLPRCFYGSTNATQRTWREIMQQAWQQGHWDSIAGLEDVIPVNEYSGPIVVFNYYQESPPVVERWKTEENYWQLNWILEETPVDIHDLRNHTDRHRSLVLSGMQHFWYCLGLLGDDYRFLYYAFRQYYVEQVPSPAVLREVVYPFITSFLKWMPQMMAFDGRLAIAQGVRGLKYVGVADQVSCLLDMLEGVGLMSEDEVYELTRGAQVVLLERLRGGRKTISGSC